MQKGFLIVVLLVIRIQLSGQTVGGSSVFNFLKLPNTTQLTALGGVNVSNISNDVGMAFNNPALLRESMHAQINPVFNNMYAGIKHFHISCAISSERYQTNFFAGIHYLNYGEIR